VKTARSLTAHIANGTLLYVEEPNEIADVGTTRASLSAAKVLLRCAKNNVQTNTSFAQRKASVSSLYLALLIEVADPALIHAKRQTHQHRHSAESGTKRDLISTADTHLLAQTARKTVAVKAQADCTIKRGFVTGAAHRSVTKMLFFAHQILSRA
jgi:hypothetical protein